MDKIVIKCPHCKEKMKIVFKVAKYRCPNCKEVYKLTSLRMFNLKIKRIFQGFVETLRDIKYNIKNRYSNAKATYNYMKQMKKNMKNDPNWSNYHKEQKEMKQANKVNGFKDFFKKKK